MIVMQPVPQVRLSDGADNCLSRCDTGTGRTGGFSRNDMFLDRNGGLFRTEGFDHTLCGDERCCRSVKGNKDGEDGYMPANPRLAARKKA